MARITVEDCLTKETNRFALVLLAAERTKQLLAGSKALVDAKGNKSVVTSLREIADGTVRFMTEEELRSERERERKEREEQRLREAAEAAASREAALTIAKSQEEDASDSDSDSSSESDSDDADSGGEVSLSGVDHLDESGAESISGSVGDTVGDRDNGSEANLDPEACGEGDGAVDVF